MHCNTSGLSLVVQSAQKTTTSTLTHRAVTSAPSVLVPSWSWPRVPMRYQTTVTYWGSLTDSAATNMSMKLTASASWTAQSVKWRGGARRDWQSVTAHQIDTVTSVSSPYPPPVQYWKLTPPYRCLPPQHCFLMWQQAPTWHHPLRHPWLAKSIESDIMSRETP